MAVTQRRKLLTAAVGVATVSYVVACGGLGGAETSGNLVAAGGSVPAGYGGAETSGNLVAAGGTNLGGQGGSGGYAGGETSGNLVAPPPPGGAGPTRGDADTRDAAPPEGAVDAGAADAAARASDAAVD